MVENKGGQEKPDNQENDSECDCDNDECEGYFWPSGSCGSDKCGHECVEYEMNTGIRAHVRLNCGNHYSGSYSHPNFAIFHMRATLL